MRFIKPIALEVTIILLAAAMMTLFAVSCRGDEPLPPVPEPIDTPSIVLPMTPEGEPTPVPDVDPRVIDTINPDEWYMIESTVSLIILQSPNGGLVVEIEESPITIKGKFAGGGGKNETRKYTSPFVYSVSGTKPGKTELILIPVGVEDEASIVRQTLTVSGQGPKPPPIIDPIDPVDPVNPTPVDPITPSKLQVVIIEDPAQRATLPPEQIAIMDGQEVRGYCKTHCVMTGSTPDFKVLSIRQDVANQPQWIKDAFAEPRPSLPTIVIQTPTQKISGPLPKTIPETKELLRKYGGA